MRKSLRLAQAHFELGERHVRERQEHIALQREIVSRLEHLREPITLQTRVTYCARWNSQEVVKGPLQIIISIADQKISVYDDGALIARSSVSTGVQGHPTPRGVFSVIGKELWHRSNIYSAAPMPYMQRITWSGIALHAGVLPGHPASHGCIRLANDFAIRLWHLTKRGTRVIIAPNNVDPVQIASPRLFSEPKTASSSQDTTNALAGKDVLTIPTAPPALVPNAQSQKDTNVLPAAGVVLQKKAAPISVFVSRKLSRLFVRQRSTPLFDVPIKVETPERPLGANVFTLLELQNEGAPISLERGVDTGDIVLAELEQKTGTRNK